MTDDFQSGFFPSKTLNRSKSDLTQLEKGSENATNSKSQKELNSNSPLRKSSPEIDNSNTSEEELNQNRANITHRKKDTKPYDIKVKYEIVQDLEIIKSNGFELTSNTLQIETVRNLIEYNVRKSIIPPKHLSDLSDWSISSNMAMPIKDVTDLITEYKGDEKHLNSFIKNIDALWTSIVAYDAAEKKRFLLVLQVKLTEKAAQAVKDIEFKDWTDVKKALKDYIKPQRNTEKAELKLTTVKQLPKEELEPYAKRVEELMEDLNKCFELEDGYEIMKKENARKARRSFENGLLSPGLRNKAIA